MNCFGGCKSKNATPAALLAQDKDRVINGSLIINGGYQDTEEEADRGLAWAWGPAGGADRSTDTGEPLHQTGADRGCGGQSRHKATSFGHRSGLRGRGRDRRSRRHRARYPSARSPGWAVRGREALRLLRRACNGLLGLLLLWLRRLGMLFR